MGNTIKFLSPLDQNDEDSKKSFGLEVEEAKKKRENKKSYPELENLYEEDDIVVENKYIPPKEQFLDAGSNKKIGKNLKSFLLGELPESNERLDVYVQTLLREVKLLEKNKELKDEKESLPDLNELDISKLNTSSKVALIVYFRKRILKEMKQKWEVLPYDCIGCIVSYISSAKDLFNILLICKDIYNTIAVVSPHCCKHIEFKFSLLKKYVKQKSFPFSYVGNLVVKKKSDIMFNVLFTKDFSDLFPNICVLSIHCCDESIDLKKVIFRLEKVEKITFQYCINIKNLKEISNAKEIYFNHCFISDEDLEEFKKFKRLKKIKVSFNNQNFTGEKFPVMYNLRSLSFEGLKISNELFKSVENLDELRILETDSIFDNIENFKFIKLKILDVNWSKSFTDEILNYFESLEVLSIYQCNNITGRGFYHLKQVKELRVKECKQINVDNISMLKKLRVLSMVKCNFKIRKTSWLRSIKLLEELYLYNCRPIKDNFENKLKRMVLLKKYSIK